MVKHLKTVEIGMCKKWLWQQYQECVQITKLSTFGQPLGKKFGLCMFRRYATGDQKGNDWEKN
jgi:hypothetical protein